MNTEILDSFIFENQRIFLKEQHIQRTQEAAELAYGRRFNEEIRDIYDKIEAEFASRSAGKIVRLTFSAHAGLQYDMELKDYVALAERIILKPITGFDYANTGFSHYKWTQRSHWERHSHLISRSTDILTVDADQNLIETSRFNVFVYIKDSHIVLTPPLSSGCLKGTFRQYCLEQKQFRVPNSIPAPLLEETISLRTAKQNLIYVANAVRGVIAAEIAES